MADRPLSGGSGGPRRSPGPGSTDGDRFYQPGGGWWRGPAQPSGPAGQRKLYRALDGRALGGVAAGIGKHVGIRPIIVRFAFVVLVSFGGLGALLYAVFWAVLPVEPGNRPVSRRETGQLVAFVALAAGIGMVQVASGWNLGHVVLGWLVAVIAVGAGIIWHQADPERRLRWTQVAPRWQWLAAITEGSRRSLALRLIGGGVLVVVGLVGITVVISPFSGGLTPMLNGLLFTLIAVAGLGLVLGPLVWRVVVALRDEREARIREQERAEIAAMVHDQVLHTLALIQRSASDPREVSRLARGQERTLRNWLYKPTASPTERLSAAMEAVSAEVEDAFAISVDTVVVGDCEVDEQVRALVAAAREALVNAGKHAKVQTVSLYAEVEPGQVSVFVRDRGVGFDRAEVEDDRHGVSGSIIGRMRRHGGEAEILSTPGEGTEVRLMMPVQGGERS